jgi:hypothetical protein
MSNNLNYFVHFLAVYNVNVAYEWLVSLFHVTTTEKENKNYSEASYSLHFLNLFRYKLDYVQFYKIFYPNECYSNNYVYIKTNNKEVNQNKVCNAEHNECYSQSKTEAAVIYNYTARVINFILIFGNNSFLCSSRHRQVPGESFRKFFVQKCFCNLSCTNYFSFRLLQYKKSDESFYPKWCFHLLPASKSPYFKTGF